MPDELVEEQEFDFEEHQKKAVDDYEAKISQYDIFSKKIKNILEEAFKRKPLKVHSIENRAKSVESFAKKAILRSEEDPNKPEYLNPLKQQHIFLLQDFL